MTNEFTNDLVKLFCVITPCVSILGKSQYAKLAPSAFANLDVYGKAVASGLSALTFVLGVVNGIILYSLILAVPLYGVAAYYHHGMTRGAAVGARHADATDPQASQKPRTTGKSSVITWCHTLAVLACLIAVGTVFSYLA